ncbi:hypothetical protein EV360DRAFT_88371 [Lentinula raphanica]|nr:hypothetical protein EV360DRAFT_88371 [Lentinula raphanica]
MARKKKDTGRKQGNQGHFHGEPLQLLESFAPAYVDAGMNKANFWKEFWLAWYQKYPPLSPSNDPSSVSEDLSSASKDSSSASQDSSSPSKEPNSSDVEAGAQDGELPASANDPSNSSAETGEDNLRNDQDIIVARTASTKKIKSWFSNRATKYKSREKNPFLQYLRRLDKKLATPRLMPLHKYFMQLPEYSAEVEERYHREFEEKDSGEVDELDDEEVDELEEEVDEEKDGGNSDGDDEEEKDELQEDDSVEKRKKSLALSRRVRIASTLLASKPKEVQEDVDRRRRADFEERKRKYESSLSGDDLFDQELLTDRRSNIVALVQPFLDALSKMTKTKVSLIVATIEDTPERKDNLFVRHAQSNNLIKKFSDWDPKAYRDGYITLFVSFVQNMIALEQGNSVPQPTQTSATSSSSTLNDLVQKNKLLSHAEEESKTADDLRRGAKRGRGDSEAVSQRKAKKRKGKEKGKARRSKDDESSESAQSSFEDSEESEDEPLVLRRSTCGKGSPPNPLPSSSHQESLPQTTQTTMIQTTTPSSQPEFNLEEDLVKMSPEDCEKHLERYGKFNPHWYSIIRRGDLEKEEVVRKKEKETAASANLTTTEGLSENLGTTDVAENFRNLGVAGNPSTSAPVISPSHPSSSNRLLLQAKGSHARPF